MNIIYTYTIFNVRSQCTFQEPGFVHHRYHMYFMEQEMCRNTDIAVQR